MEPVQLATQIERPQVPRRKFAAYNGGVAAGVWPGCSKKQSRINASLQLSMCWLRFGYRCLTVNSA